jgi:hypothetical protein
MQNLVFFNALHIFTKIQLVTQRISCWKVVHSARGIRKILVQKDRSLYLNGKFTFLEINNTGQIVKMYEHGVKFKETSNWTNQNPLC